MVFSWTKIQMICCLIPGSGSGWRGHANTALGPQGPVESSFADERVLQELQTWIQGSYAPSEINWRANSHRRGFPTWSENIWEQEKNQVQQVPLPRTQVSQIHPGEASQKWPGSCAVDKKQCQGPLSVVSWTNLMGGWGQRWTTPLIIKPPWVANTQLHTNAFSISLGLSVGKLESEDEVSTRDKHWWKFGDLGDSNSIVAIGKQGIICNEITDIGNLDDGMGYIWTQLI